MNLGFWSCILMVPVFALLGIVFAALKEKSASIISGFNTLPKHEQEMYDKKRLVQDMRDLCFWSAAILLIGALLSYLITPYLAIPTFIIWLILMFRDAHIDPRKAFEKYLLK